MNIYDKITDREKNKLTTYIETFGGFDEDGYGRNCDMSQPLDVVLREYLNKKQELFKLFGEELILTKEISYSKSADELGDILSCNSDITSFMNDFCSNISFLYEDHWNLYRNLRRLFYWPDFANNKYSGDSFEFIHPYKEGSQVIKVQNGMKMTKIFSKLQEPLELSKTKLENFRLAHSRILNDKTLKGELCLSIHPLDYITMSDNNSNWSSCMSWTNGGGYRGGTVEMMNSPIVVVGYLKGSNDFHFCGESWNNKKWRCLFVVEPELICSVKAYPYYQNELIDACVKWLAELAQKNWNCGLSPDAPVGKHDRFTFTYDNNGRTFPQGGKLEFTTEDHSMYNDFGCSTSHHYIISDDLIKWFEETEDTPLYVIPYAGELTCMTCGDYIDPEYEGEVLCHQCYDPPRCCECGCVLYDGGSTGIDGCYYCECCYDDIFDYDELEHDSIYQDESVELIAQPYGFYITTHYKNVSKYWEHWFKKKPEDNEDYYTIDITDLTKNALDALPRYFRTRQTERLEHLSLLQSKLL